MADPNPDPNPDIELYDLTILGGGPAGLFAAYYAGLRQMRTKIIDSLAELGGQLSALYPEKYIFDIPGFPKILARDLAKNLVEQAMQYRPAIALGELVSHLEPITELPNAYPAAEPLPPPAYRLTTDKGVHYTRTVLIAAGSGAFAPKKLPLPEAAALENHSIFYAVPSKATFAGKKLLIIGGGDSAIDWALNLHGVASAITLIHRRNQFRAHEASVRRVQSLGIPILTFHELDAVIPSGTADGNITGVVLRDNRIDETRTLDAEVILVQIGFNSSLGPLKDWGLPIDRNGIRVNAFMETPLPGVFAAGDVAAYEGKLKLIANGFGEAAAAVNYAKTRLDPKARAFPGHSSEMTAQPEGLTTL